MSECRTHLHVGNGVQESAEQGLGVGHAAGHLAEP